MNKEAALNELNEIKQDYIKAKTNGDTCSMNIIFGKYIGMALAYYQCGLLTISEHSNALKEIAVNIGCGQGREN